MNYFFTQHEGAQRLSLPNSERIDDRSECEVVIKDH